MSSRLFNHSLHTPQISVRSLPNSFWNIFWRWEIDILGEIDFNQNIIYKYMLVIILWRKSLSSDLALRIQIHGKHHFVTRKLTIMIFQWMDVGVWCLTVCHNKYPWFVIHVPYSLTINCTRKQQTNDGSRLTSKNKIEHSYSNRTNILWLYIASPTVAGFCCFW